MSFDRKAFAEIFKLSLTPVLELLQLPQCLGKTFLLHPHVLIVCEEVVKSFNAQDLSIIFVSDEVFHGYLIISALF